MKRGRMLKAELSDGGTVDVCRIPDGWTAETVSKAIGSFVPLRALAVDVVSMLVQAEEKRPLTGPEKIVLERARASL